MQQKIENLVKNGQLAAAKDYMTTNESYHGELESVLANLLSLNVDDATQITQKTSKVIAKTGQYLLILLIIAANIGLFSAFILWTAIRPLSVLNRAVGKLEKGEIYLPLAIDSFARDEVGQMAFSYEKMRQKLAEVIGKACEVSNVVANNAIEIGATTEELAKIAAEQARTASQTSNSTRVMSDNAKEISHAADLLATEIGEVEHSVLQISGTLEQVANIVDNLCTATGQIAGNIEEVVANIEEVANTAQESKAAADSNRTSAQNGQQAVGATAEGLQEASAVVDDIMTSIKKLSESSIKIGDITSLIDDIADQTNMLALNAAIEAARAGEAGRGFAVVAEEVRRLAERSAKATKEIAGLIKSIQHETKQAVALTNHNYQVIGDGTKRSERAALALEAIVTASLRTSALMDAIAQATAGQKTIALKMRLAAENMNSLTREVSQTVRREAQGGVGVTQAVKGVVDKVCQRAVYLSQAMAESLTQSEALLHNATTLSLQAKESAISTDDIAASAEGLSAQAHNLLAAISFFEDKRTVPRAADANDRATKIVTFMHN
ncbi:MAG: methyl-accepting chemotaxis protein [Cyanobacteria bacterium NC_groundwater_1444_Ag_S-0.65um_54_12]|nr:methyl-accepting chemotaxis protein [Cyanobacteria bacterium NC_groundwater_1444_Ag_S-0.65um_54_12]